MIFNESTLYFMYSTSSVNRSVKAYFWATLLHVRSLSHWFINSRRLINSSVVNNNLCVVGFCRPTDVDVPSDRMSACIDEVSSWIRYIRSHQMLGTM